MGNSGGEFHRYVVIIVITVVDILDKVSECDSTLLCDVTGAADAAADAGVARRPIVTALTSVRLPRRRIHALCVTNIYNNKTIILEIDRTIDSYLTAFLKSQTVILLSECCTAICIDFYIFYIF